MNTPNPHLSLFRKTAYFIFFAVLLLKFSTLAKPFLGYFSGYQVYSGMVAQMFVSNDFGNLLLPQAQYLIKGVPAVVLIYYPLASLLAGLCHVLSGLSLDISGRLVSILFFDSLHFDI